MRHYFLFLAILVGLLIGCNQNSPESSVSTLTVGDGTNQKSYDVEALKAVGAEQATFREVVYTGVPLRLLLEDAGFDPTTLSAVRATAADGFSANYDPDLVNRPDTLVAYAQSDGPLTGEDGTFRMVLPDQEGKLNPRDIVKIRIYP